MPPTGRSDDDDNHNTASVSWTGDTTTSNTTTNGVARSSHNEHADTTITTFDIHPSSSLSNSSSTDNNNNNDNHQTNSSAPNDSNNSTLNTARWTRYLPESYGIRQSVESSKYRWCARESAMWGIATGSAMAFHRIRMNSPLSRVINVGFSSVFLVMGGSYYFCVKRRDYQEQMIELLMQLNTFEPVKNMPPERPIDETHPFVRPETAMTTGDDDDPSFQQQQPIPTKQYVAHLPERKEWQTQIPTQDATNIFQPYESNDNDKKNP